MNDQPLEDVPIKAAVKGSETVKSLRFRLEILLLIIAVPAIAIIIQMGVLERARLLEERAEKTDAITARMGRAQARRIDETRAFLIELAQAPALQDPGSPECGAFLAGVLPLVPNYLNLGVSDASGKMVCAGAAGAEPVDLGDQGYFQKTMQEGGFNAGTYMFDRGLQQASIGFSYPVRTKDTGDIAGVLIAFVALDWWSDRLAEESLPENSVAYIIDSHNQMVATFPKQEDLHGRAAKNFGGGKDWQRTETAETFDAGDGVRRVYSHRVFYDGGADQKLFLSLGLAGDEALQGARNRILLHLALITAVVVLLWRLAARVMERTVYKPFNALHREVVRLVDRQGGSDSAAQPVSASSVTEIDALTQSIRGISNERQEAEADRQHRVETMSALLEALPDTYFRVGPEGEILDYRAYNEADLYLSPETFLGSKFTDILPADLGAKFEEIRLKVVETGGVPAWEYTLGVAGKTQHFEARVCPVSDRKETIFVIRNISDRHEAEMMQRAAEERLDLIIRNLPGAVIQSEYAAEGQVKITYVSPKCEAIWEASAEEILADPGILSRAHDPDDLVQFRELRRQALETGAQFQHRYKITSRSGVTRWLDFFGSQPRSKSDGAKVVEAFFLDVTREIEAQHRFEHEREVSSRAQKNEAIGQMTGGVAHDFNNLLAVIMGNLELLLDDIEQEEHRQLITGSINATKRGADLTGNMLAFARKARLEPEIIDLNRLVSDAGNWIGRTLSARISVETTLLAGLWKITADPSSTESALLNLIVNARDAMPEGGSLTIETANMRIDQTYVDSRLAELEPGRYVMLAVSDTGHGMSEDTVQHVFDPFYSTKAPGAGSGLGLSMVEGFMRQSGGTVQVYSEPDVGTTFKLYFPVSADEPDAIVAPPIERSEADHTQSGRILAVEDEAEVLAILVTVLEKAGYEVVEAASGDQALEIFTRDPDGFDMLLTDIVMPGKLQGTTLSRRLRELAPELPVVFMSGYASESTIHGNGLRPEDIRLMKPVQRRDLLAAVFKAVTTGLKQPPSS